MRIEGCQVEGASVVYSSKETNSRRSLRMSFVLSLRGGTGCLRTNGRSEEKGDRGTSKVRSVRLEELNKKSV